MTASFINKYQTNIRKLGRHVLPEHTLCVVRHCLSWLSEWIMLKNQQSAHYGEKHLQDTHKNRTTINPEWPRARFSRCPNFDRRMSVCSGRFAAFFKRENASDESAGLYSLSLFIYMRDSYLVSIYQILFFFRPLDYLACHDNGQSESVVLCFVFVESIRIRIPESAGRKWSFRLPLPLGFI